MKVNLLRKTLIISINILLIVILVLLIFKPFEKQRLIDRYIRYNITSELSMLRLVIDDLERELIVDDAYMTLERDAFLTIVKDAQYQVLLIDKSIGKLGLLNKNFDFNLNGLSDYLFRLETAVSSDKEPSEEEIKALISLTELMDECSVSTKLSYYPDDGTGFTRLEVPEKTQLLFDEISKLEDVN